MAPGVGVGEGRDEQGSSMRAHMQAVGNQGHRAEQRSADDLCGHHDAAEHDDGPGLAFVARMVGAEKQMLVAEVLNGMAGPLWAPPGSACGCTLQINMY